MLSNCIKIKHKNNLINNHNSNLIYNISNKIKTCPITRIKTDYCVELARFPVRESYHIASLCKKLLQLTLVLKIPKIRTKN